MVCFLDVMAMLKNNPSKKCFWIIFEIKNLLKTFWTKSNYDFFPNNWIPAWFIPLPYSLYYSPDSIRVLSRIQSRKLNLLFSKKWQKLKYNPAQKSKKNRVLGCNIDFTVFWIWNKILRVGFQWWRKLIRGFGKC